MLKFEDNPPAISIGSAASVCETPGRWWVGHTKARFEKSFAFDLLGRGIHYFLPLLERVRLSGGRKRRVMIPLFQSYVFFCGEEADRCAALATGRLCQVIPVRDQARFVAEIAAVEQAIRSGAALTPFMGIAVGRPCRITGGALENLCGTLVQHRGSTAQVALGVKMLGQGALVEIDAALLEPAEELEAATIA
ncbi:MAG: transcription termination/antitermination NusG family protein [Tepidisphaeraceae bacterium]